MDFLDPKKQRRHTIVLFSGYMLIGLAVVVATIVLLYEAYGFGLGKNGTIIQKGLVYLSSQPNPAKVTINGKLSTSTTNTALTLPEGIYNIQLNRAGYRTWSRSVEVDGGTIKSYTYPLLIPIQLTTTKLKSYTAAPALASQSPSRRWLLIQQPGSASDFDLYDLNQKNPVATTVSVPTSDFTKGTSSDSWQVVAWANDNQHVLFNHSFDGKNEYVMFNIANPSQTFNLSSDLNGVSFSSITLNNNRYDQYYLYNSANQSLMSDSLSSATSPTTVATNVLSYVSYGNSTVLYATTNGADKGKVDIDILSGGTVYKVKTFNAGSTYLLDMAGYSGTVYVVAGASSENKVYIYRDPVSQLQADPDHAAVPVQVLFVTSPNTVSFSANTQFIEAESSQQFAVYDIENTRGYSYSSKLPLDTPQTKAVWMDGDRLTYVSGGKRYIFEYDDNYSQQMMSAIANYLPFFDPNYVYTYALAPGQNGTVDLSRTSFYTPADQP